MAQPQYRIQSTSSYFPPGVKWLIIVNSAIFVLFYLGRGALQQNMMLLFALWPETTVRSLWVWQLFTYMFLHGGFTHLLFNMLSLWFFGVILERTWGTRRFLKYYFYCGIAAGVCVVVVNLLMHQSPATIGASGAVFGILVAFGVLFPDSTVLMSFLFPIKAKYMVMIYAAIELIVTLGPNTGVSTVAHLGGMAFGYLYLKRKIPAVSMPNLRGAYTRWKLARAKRKFQVYMKKHGNGPWVN